MSKPKPSAESVKVWREWCNLSDDLTALERKEFALEFHVTMGSKSPGHLSPEDAALKSKIKARMEELWPVVERDFPL
jgi:hypothetical protein